MMKYDLAKLFGNVDDKFIEGAKPEAQKPVLVMVKRRSPIKIAVTASCAALVLACGVLAVNAAHSGGVKTALESRSSAHISNDSTESSSVSIEWNDSSGNWCNTDEICYEGEIYKVLENSRKLISDEDFADIKLSVLVGRRISAENDAEIVTVLKNLYNTPLGVWIDDADYVVAIKTVFGDKAPEPDKTRIRNGKSSVFVLQPGEVYYYKNSFTGEKYGGDLMYGFSDPVSNGHYGDWSNELLRYRWMIDDGIKTDSASPAEKLDLTTDLDGDGIPDKLKELNPHVTDEEWEIYKKMENPEAYGLIYDGTVISSDGRVVTEYYHEP